jgi:hypothetical protein
MGTFMDKLKKLRSEIREINKERFKDISIENPKLLHILANDGNYTGLVNSVKIEEFSTTFCFQFCVYRHYSVDDEKFKSCGLKSISVSVDTENLDLKVHDIDIVSYTGAIMEMCEDKGAYYDD